MNRIIALWLVFAFACGALWAYVLVATPRAWVYACCAGMCAALFVLVLCACLWGLY